MNKIKGSRLLLATCIFIIWGCGPQQDGAKKIRVATAANMQFAMKAIAGEFTKQTGIECELIVSSSGKLTAQISEGAPYDVFVSADMKYPEKIHNLGLAKSPPEVYALGKLALWSMVEGIEPLPDVLTGDWIKHVAIANPKIAPYGVAAMEVLDFYGIREVVGDKIVFGESIAQANQFITSRAAEIGFTAMSVVLSPEMKGKGVWMELDPSTYTPIEQGIVIISHGIEKNDDATRFYKFIFSENAGKILKDYGYSVRE